MRTILAVAVIGVFLSASSGCATTRNAQSSFYRPADWYSSESGYRPWNDVNSGGLPPLGFWGGRNFIDCNSPTVRLPPP
jgi:hypothetical protein